MFRRATFEDESIGRWDTSNVKSIGEMFLWAQRFNVPLHDWDTSNVTDMHAMFTYAEALNQPIGSWSTGNVMSMSELFSYADSLNQPLATWNTSNVVNMSKMFKKTTSFSQPVADVEHVACDRHACHVFSCQPVYSAPRLLDDVKREGHGLNVRECSQL